MRTVTFVALLRSLPPCTVLTRTLISGSAVVLACRNPKKGEELKKELEGAAAAEGRAVPNLEVGGWWRVEGSCWRMGDATHQTGALKGGLCN